MLCLALLVACVKTPASGTPGIEGDSVTFSGVDAKNATERVWIEVKVEGGGWRRLEPAATLAHDGSWSTTVTVPSDAVRSPPCESVVFRAVRDNGTLLAGVDAECLAGLGPAPTARQRLACSTMTVTLATSVVHSGDLSIVGPDEAALHACLTRVDGNLTLDGGESGVIPIGPREQPGHPGGVTLTLPRLQRVAGSLIVRGRYAERIDLPELSQLDGDLELTLHAFTADVEGEATTMVTALGTPRLSAVGGTLKLENTKDELTGWGSGQWTYHYGLDSLTSVHDVSVNNSVFPSTLAGVAGLSSVPGHVRIEWKPEVKAGALLPNLTTIGGDLTIAPHQQIHQLLPKVERVHGSVSIAPPAEKRCMMVKEILAALSQIDGDLTIDHCTDDLLGTPAILPALSRVGGTLSLWHGAPPLLGAPFGTLRLGGLSIAKTEVEHIPLPWDIRMTSASGGIGASGVSLTSNSKLCQCEVDSFVACLARGGWTGRATTALNLDCPAPCPAMGTCPAAIRPPAP